MNLGLGKRSLERLGTCDERLQELFKEVANRISITILCGHRTEAEQEAAKDGGFSKVDWPKSKHNAFPSKAVDAGPWPLDWSDKEAFKKVYKVVMEVADEKGIKIRAGADFNMDGDLTNDKFIDLPHFELKE